MNTLLTGVPLDQRDEAARILRACPAAPLTAGQSRAGLALPPAELIVVETGIALVSAVRPEARRRMIVAVAGWGAILAPPSDSERIDALTDCRLTVVPQVAYRLLLRLPDVAEAIASGLLESLRERQESLAQFSSVKHVARVRAKLLQLAEAHGKVAPDGIRLDLPLTHELLGEMTGSARETVTWALAELSRSGFIRREGRSYRLSVEPDALLAS